MKQTYIQNALIRIGKEKERDNAILNRTKKENLSFELVKYLWDNGVYTIENMKYLVQNSIISK